MKDINVDLFQWSIDFSKTISGGGIRNANISSKQLAEDLRKSVIRTFNIKKYTHLL